MEQKEVMGRKGIKYIETVVANVGQMVPAQYQGKFLLYDGKRGVLVNRAIVRKTPEEKEANRKRRFEQAKARWSGQVELNRQVTEKVNSLNNDLKNLRRSIKLKALTEDVSTMREEYVNKLAELDQWRAKRKLVPQKFR